MLTVTTQELARNLSRYLAKARLGEHIVITDNATPLALLSPPAENYAQDDEATRLAALAAEGLVILPENSSSRPFSHPRVPARGRLTSELAIEDRR